MMSQSYFYWNDQVLNFTEILSYRLCSKIFYLCSLPIWNILDTNLKLPTNMILIVTIKHVNSFSSLWSYKPESTGFPMGILNNRAQIWERKTRSGLSNYLLTSTSPSTSCLSPLFWKMKISPPYLPWLTGL